MVVPRVAVLLLAFALPACAAPGAAPGATPEAAPIPEQTLWLWERPEDLRFLAASESPPELALLVAQVRLRGGELEVYGRRQPLALPPGLPAPLPVVRIETVPGSPPSLASEQRRRLAELLAHHADRRRQPAIQLDFDATRSQRSFYAELLRDLAARLPAGSGISITALVSWCRDDGWLAGLPIAEAVPMLFRMGAEASATRRWLDAGHDFPEPLCRHSYGISTDEPRPKRRPGRRLYHFHPASWTTDAWRAADAGSSTPR